MATLTPNRFKFLINLWPPYLGPGIRVNSVSSDWRRIEVQLKLRWYNQNYVRTHFGGSLFSMTDPFFMLILIRNLGKNYIVWDQAATIKYLKPGKGTVKALFEISETDIQSIKQQADTSEKIRPVFLAEVKDEQGDVVAVVEKTLYIKKKSN